jgi:hypothetical protein
MPSIAELLDRIVNEPKNSELLAVLGDFEVDDLFAAYDAPLRGEQEMALEDVLMCKLYEGAFTLHSLISRATFDGRLRARLCALSLLSRAGAPDFPAGEVVLAIAPLLRDEDDEFTYNVMCTIDDLAQERI